MGFTNILRVRKYNLKMKLGFVLFAAAAQAGPEPCHDKSEKRLGKMTDAFEEWASEYATAKRGPTTAGNMIKRVNNITRKMLEHYTKFNEEICNSGARMGDEEDDLSYDDCVGGLKVLKQLRNWSRANNRVKKFERVAARVRDLSDSWELSVCGEHQ